jgi:hypothetical protein
MPERDEGGVMRGERWRLSGLTAPVVVLVRGVGEAYGKRGGKLWLEVVQGDPDGLHPRHGLHEKDLTDSPNAERIS